MILKTMTFGLALAAIAGVSEAQTAGADSALKAASLNVALCEQTLAMIRKADVSIVPSVAPEPYRTTWRSWCRRATVDEDGHYCLTVAL
jgi:hypothetical protein